MPCPVTRTCLQVLHTYFFESRRKALFADLEDTWEELVERADKDDPIEDTVLYRCFFAVTAVQHFIIPELFFPNTMKGTPERFSSYCCTCDVESLDVLLEEAKRAERDFSIYRAELQFDNVNNVLIKTNMYLITASRVLSLLHTMAHSLQTSLRHGVPPQAVVIGKFFGEALTQTSTDFMKCHRLLSAMLSSSLHNPISTWKMSRSSDST